MGRDGWEISAHATSVPDHEPIQGKPFEQILPLRQRLSNRAVRRWYFAQDAEIPFKIDQSLSIEDQAHQVCDMRNKNRTSARDLMRDKRKCKQLDREDQNKTLEERIDDKIKGKGLTREQVVEDVLKSASKTRKPVNKQLRVE